LRAGSSALPALCAYGVYQLRLAQLAATVNVEVAGDIAQFVHRARLQRGVGIAPTLGASLRRATFLPPVAVHRAACDLAGAALGHAPILIAFPDMLELALVLAVPCGWHESPPFSSWFRDERRSTCAGGVRQGELIHGHRKLLHHATLQ